jgi:hypothetical protein
MSHPVESASCEEGEWWEGFFLMGLLLSHEVSRTAVLPADTVRMVKFTKSLAFVAIAATSIVCMEHAAVAKPIVGSTCTTLGSSQKSSGLTCSTSPLDATQKIWIPTWGADCTKRLQKFWNMQCDYIYATRAREVSSVLEWDVVSIPRIGKLPKGTPLEIAQQFAVDVGALWNLSNGKNFVTEGKPYIGGCDGWACSGYHPRIYATVWKKYARAKVMVRVAVAKGAYIAGKFTSTIPNFATCYSLKIQGTWYRALLDYGQYQRGGEAYAAVLGACK